MPKLTISQLRKIISEEVQVLREGEKEDQAAAMAQNASKLLKAIESFKSVASAKAKSGADSSGASLEKHLLETEKMLKRIVASPLEYVDGPKVAPQPSDAGSKKVTLKPAT
jgi:hypothetical protein